jgi:hypothetical protein
MKAFENSVKSQSRAKTTENCVLGRGGRQRLFYRNAPLLVRGKYRGDREGGMGGWEGGATDTIAHLRSPT